MKIKHFLVVERYIRNFQTKTSHLRGSEMLEFLCHKLKLFLEVLKLKKTKQNCIHISLPICHKLCPKNDYWLTSSLTNVAVWSLWEIRC